MKKIVLTIILSLLLLNPVSVSAHEYKEMIEEVAELYGCCPELIEAICIVESEMNPEAVSSCGAVGMMQVLPKWHKDRMKRLGVTDLTDAYSNILVGTDILMEYAEQTEDVYQCLVAYNCGLDSKTLKRVKEGGTWSYADDVLKLAHELEEEHDK